MTEHRAEGTLITVNTEALLIDALAQLGVRSPERAARLRRARYEEGSFAGGLLTVARRRGPTLAIDLDGDPYIAMILSVDDLQDAVATVKGALRLRHR